VQDPELDARRRSRGGSRRAFSAISAGISGRGGGRSATSVRLSIRLSNPTRRQLPALVASRPAAAASWSNCSRRASRAPSSWARISDSAAPASGCSSAVSTPPCSVTIRSRPSAYLDRTIDRWISPLSAWYSRVSRGLPTHRPAPGGTVGPHRRTRRVRRRRPPRPPRPASAPICWRRPIPPAVCSAR